MRVTILNARLSFADTIRIPKPFRGKEPRHSANAICHDGTMLVVEVDGETHKIKPRDFQRVIDRVCKDRWGKTPAKLKNWVFNPADGSGTREKYIDKDGDYHQGYDENTWFFAANKNQSQAPDGIQIVDQKREPLPSTSGHPISGDYVNMIIDVYAFEAENDKGISASLEGIQYVRKGEPFGGKRPLDAKSAFPEEEMEDDVEDGDDASSMF